MPRVKIQKADTGVYRFNCKVRVNDLNYGNHLANDKFLLYAHEARMAWLQSIQQSELSFFGVSLIQGDAAIVYQSEGFFADEIEIEVGVADISNSSYDLIYDMFNATKGKSLALVKTRMVCFNYSDRKVEALPESFRQYLASLS